MLVTFCHTISVAYSYDHMDLMRDCHMPCPSPPEHMQLLIREPACSCLLTMTPMGIPAQCRRLMLVQNASLMP